MPKQVQKPFLKKTEATKAMMNKSWKIVCDRFKEMKEVQTEDGDDHTAVPAALSPLLTQINQKITTAKNRMESNDFNLTDLLNELPDDKVKGILLLFENPEENFKHKENKFVSEDMLVSLACLLIGEMEQLGTMYQAKQTRARADILRTFLEAYGKQFSKMRGTDLIYNHHPFVEGVKNLIQYRRGLRRASAMARPDGEGEEIPEPSDERRCAIM